MTITNVLTLIGLLIGAVGIMWRVQASGSSTRELLRKELKDNTDLFFTKLDKLDDKLDKNVSTIDKISVESKYVRRDHDNLVRLEKDVEKNTKDIRNQHGKIREVYLDMNKHVAKKG